MPPVPAMFLLHQTKSKHQQDYHAGKRTILLTDDPIGELKVQAAHVQVELDCLKDGKQRFLPGRMCAVLFVFLLLLLRNEEDNVFAFFLCESYNPETETTGSQACKSP